MNFTDVERVLQTCMVGIDDNDADRREKRECRQQASVTLRCYWGLASGDRERLSGLSPEFARLEAPAALARSRAQQRCRSRAPALRRVFERLPDVLGLSSSATAPRKAAVFGLTGDAVRPMAKGDGVLLVSEDEGFRVEPLFELVAQPRGALVPSSHRQGHPEASSPASPI